VVSNRIKFFFAAPVLEAANRRFPGRPHQRLASLVANDDRQVLEIRAGTGYLARLVARAHPGTEIHALDLSPEMVAVGRRLAAAERLGRVTFVHGDAGALPFAHDHFDVVMASFGLHELPTAVRAAALAEAARVVRASGPACLSSISTRRRDPRGSSTRTCAPWRSHTPARSCARGLSAPSLERGSISSITTPRKPDRSPSS